MAVDLDAEVKRRKIADSLTNGDDEETEPADSTDETDSTDSTEETDSSKETTAPEEPAAEPAATPRQQAGFLSFSDYSGTPAASPTPTPSAADRIGPFTHAIAEDQPVADYVPSPVPRTVFDTESKQYVGTSEQPPAEATPTTVFDTESKQFVGTGAQLEAAPVPAGHIDLGPSGRNIYTDPDTGARYTIDPATGQMVPHAELATAADKAAMPPGDVGLPRAVVKSAAPAPDRLTQVERGELVGLPWHPAHPEQLEDRGERGTPITPVGPAPDRLTQVEKGIALPPKVQPAQPVLAPAPQPSIQTSGKSIEGVQQKTDVTTMPVSPKAPKPDGQPSAQPVAQPPAPSQAAPAVPPPVTGELAQGPPGTHPAGTHDEPYWPKRPEQIGQLPPGSVYVDPRDGSLKTTPGVVAPSTQKAPAEATQPVPAPTQASARQAAGFLSFDDYAHPKPAVAAQPTAAQQPAAPAQVPAEPQIDIQAQSYTKGRTQEPNKLILHSSDGTSVQGDVNTLTGAEPGHRVSANYYVTKDGRVLHLVSENDTAWHAGADRFGGNGNAYTLGIEQQHVDGKEPWPDAQVRATAGVVAGILARHPNMTIDDVIGHSDLAGERKQDPVDYPWAKFRKYVAEAQGQPAVAQQAAAPSAQPVTKQKNGFYQGEDQNSFLTGRLTTFATKDDIASGQDNGVGAPHLGQLDTTQVAGVALPQWVLQQYFGNNYAAMRQARVDVVDSTTGKRLRVPIVDIGPGSGSESAGVIADMTPALATYFGGDKNLSIKIVPKAGPDVMKNGQLFYDEQAAIKNGFDSSSLDPKRQVIGQPGAPLRAQTPEEATAAQQKVQAAIQKQTDILAKLPEAQGDNPNLIGYYKRLDDPVDGVTAPMRQAMQANLKPQIIAAMREKFPDIKTDEEAWAKAQSDVGPLEVGAEAWSKVLGGFQQYTSVLQKGVAGTDQLHVNQFLDQAMPGATDQAKQAYLAKLYGMPIDQRIAEVQSHLPQPQTGMPSTDPQQIISALDRIHSTDYQKQQALDLATAAADMKRNLTTDPRLVGTGVGKIIDNVAQIPAFVAAYSNPVMLPLVLAQTNDMARTQLRADHPDWDEKTISENAARATAVMFLGQEAGAKLMGAGGGALLNALEGKGKRAIAQALVGLGGGTAIGAGTQAGVNIATGQPILRGVGEAATSGAIQGLTTGLVHGGGELIRPTERAAPAVVQPPAVEPPRTEPERPLPRPVTPSEILGPETPDTTPWYKPGPIVTRAGEPETFTPAGLAAGVAGMREAGTPEEMRQAAENLQPAVDFNRLNAYLGDEGQAEIYRALEAQRQPLGVGPTEAPPPSRPLPPEPGRIGEAEPWISREANKTTASGVANIYTKERMASGELAQIDPNLGVTTEELLARGARMGPEAINQHISDLMNGKGGNLRDQAAATRMEEARLTQRARQLSFQSEENPGNQQLKIDAENAYKDLSDFHAGPVKKMKDTFHVAGVGLQGEPEVDLSTFNGLREKFLKETGKNPPPSAETRLRKVADQVRKTHAAEYEARNRAVTQAQNERRSLPSEDEVRAHIMRILKDLPCPN